MFILDEYRTMQLFIYEWGGIGWKPLLPGSVCAIFYDIRNKYIFFSELFFTDYVINRG
jgi:hypothetical protein